MINNNGVRNFKVINTREINNLKIETAKKGKGWDRICLHKNANCKIHSMIMCMSADTESGYHQNKNSKDIITYSFLGDSFKVKIIEDINNKTEETIKIDSGNPIISIQDNIFRSILNTSKKSITYLEHRAGPYIKENIIWL